MYIDKLGELFELMLVTIFIFYIFSAQFNCNKNKRMAIANRLICYLVKNDSNRSQKVLIS